MRRPYNIDYTVDMIGHHRKRVQFHATEMPGDFIPTFSDNPAKFIFNHFIPHHIPK